MTNDNKNNLHCSFIYRIPPEGPLETVAQVGGQKDTSSSSSYETIVRDVIAHDRPLTGITTAASSSLGDFKVVQREDFRVVHGSDGDGICKCVLHNCARQAVATPTSRLTLRLFRFSPSQVSPL